MADKEQLADRRLVLKLALLNSLFTVGVGTGLLDEGGQPYPEFVIGGGLGVVICVALLWWANHGNLTDE